MADDNTPSIAPPEQVDSARTPLRLRFLIPPRETRRLKWADYVAIQRFANNEFDWEGQLNLISRFMVDAQNIPVPPKEAKQILQALEGTQIGEAFGLFLDAWSRAEVPLASGGNSSAG